MDARAYAANWQAPRPECVSGLAVSASTAGLHELGLLQFLHVQNAVFVRVQPLEFSLHEIHELLLGDRAALVRVHENQQLFRSEVLPLSRLQAASVPASSCFSSLVWFQSLQNLPDSTPARRKHTPAWNSKSAPAVQEETKPFRSSIPCEALAASASPRLKGTSSAANGIRHLGVDGKLAQVRGLAYTKVTKEQKTEPLSSWRSPFLRACASAICCSRPS